MKWLIFLVTLGALSLASQAKASFAEAAYIIYPMAIGNGVILFTQTGNRTGTVPTCSTVPSRWSLDASTPGGQAKLSVLLSAYAMHKPIQIYGTSSCTAWPDSETIDYIAVQEN